MTSFFTHQGGSRQGGMLAVEGAWSWCGWNPGVSQLVGEDWYTLHLAWSRCDQTYYISNFTRLVSRLVRLPHRTEVVCSKAGWLPGRVWAGPAWAWWRSAGDRLSHRNLPGISTSLARSCSPSPGSWLSGDSPTASSKKMGQPRTPCLASSSGGSLWWCLSSWQRFAGPRHPQYSPHIPESVTSSSSALVL